MSPSSKFSMRMGRHQTPRICRKPPPRIIPIIPPVPYQCPPATISGYIDAWWETLEGEHEYYAAYEAVYDAMDEPWEYKSEAALDPGHNLTIQMWQTPPHVLAHILIRDEHGDELTTHSEPHDFVWCTQAGFLISAWEPIEDVEFDLTMLLVWSDEQAAPWPA